MKAVMRAISKRERILGGLWGSLVGDALGVPVEFKDRATVQAQPVTGMRGYGTHNQPPGTWSDDGALILCTVDSLLRAEFDTQDMGERFMKWKYHGLWTAWGKPFDVGVATSDALMRIANGTPAEEAGSRDERSNGNGSLMRILPVALRCAHEPEDEFAYYIERASSITHGHSRSKMACVFYGLLAANLLCGLQPLSALAVARARFTALYERTAEFSHFGRILDDDFTLLSEDDVASTGYVLNTLHASLWCLLGSKNFDECVLKAVNLGLDSDTTGCVAGGLAGTYFGLNAIPKDWLRAMARREDVDLLFDQFAKALQT